MSVSASTANNPLAYLQSLLQQGSATSGTATSNPLEELLASLSGSGQGGQTAATATSGTTPSSASNVPPLSPDMMAALISFQSQPTVPSSTSLSSQLFAKLDANGDGTISKTEFESAFGSNADTTKVDALFSKLDTNGDGSVSQTELDQSLKGHGHRHHHHVGGGGGGGGSAGTDPTASTDATGASTQSITNSDGSTTTTITYADGSKIDMTIPAPSPTSGSTSAGSGGQTGTNFLEQLIKLQAQALTVAAGVAITAAI